MHRGATLTHQPREHLDHVARTDLPIDLDCQSFLREFVLHRQAFKLLAIGTGIEYEIDRPHLVRADRGLRPWT